MSVSIEKPNRAPKRRSNREKFAWLFMRASGVLLVVLVFGHLYSNLMTGEGVHQIDWGFVAGKLSSPFWRIWDTLLLWLAMLHGANGMRTVINDYVDRESVRRGLRISLFILSGLLIVLGTWVIVGFDPCSFQGTSADLRQALSCK